MHSLNDGVQYVESPFRIFKQMLFACVQVLVVADAELIAPTVTSVAATIPKAIFCIRISP
jgi:hypothetical protein